MPTPSVAYVEAAHYLGEIDISEDGAVERFFGNLPSDKRAIVIRYLLSREGSQFYFRVSQCPLCDSAGVVGGGFATKADYCTCAIGQAERVRRTPLVELPIAQRFIAAVEKEISMVSLKQRIHNLLSWKKVGLTVKEIVDELPTAKDRRSTVERALRSLREEGKTWAQVNAGTQHKSWFAVDAAATTASTVNVFPSIPTPNQKAQTMSPLLTLTLAVEAITNEFVSAKRAFSAYNVTTELRERVSKKLVTIDPDETGLLFAGGPNRIDHDTIKEIVHGLFGDHKLDGYTRQLNGAYWEYTPLSTLASVPDTQASPV